MVSSTGEPVWYSLVDPSMAHLVIAGTTGSGKTNALQWLLFRLLAQNPPEQLRWVAVDWKGHDLAPFFGLSAHLLHPIVRADPLAALQLLTWAVDETRRRLRNNCHTPATI